MAGITENEIKEKFGKRLTQLREEAGYSKTAFADLLGIERVALSDLEKGNRNVTLKTLAVLANALELPVVTLLDFEDLLKTPSKKVKASSKKGVPKKTKNK